MGDILDQAMSKAFRGGKAVRFLQIGGNDGVHQDPLYDYHVSGEFHFDWGHIFEPIPEYFEQLVINMRPYPYVTCHELAVDAAETPCTREFSYVSAEDISRHGLPPSSKGIGSFSLEAGATAYPASKYETIKEYIRTIKVKTIPMSHLIDRFAAANMLLTDCEGYDTSLIDAAFRNGGFRPEIIQFEDHGQNAQLLEDVLGRLHGLGYSSTKSGKDYVCQFC
jgi:hypothetical protein